MAAPRRSRLLASLTTSTALLYLAALSPTAALESDVSDAPNVLLDDLRLNGGSNGRLRGLDHSYESEFTVLGGGGLRGRASDGVNVLGNNEPKRITLERGSLAHFAFSLDGISKPDESATPAGELRRRDAAQDGDGTLNTTGNESEGGLLRRQEESRTVFVSANICRYPERVGGAPSSTPPPLRLLVSSDGSDERPDSTQSTTLTEVFYQGAATMRIRASSSAIYFSIESPNLPDDDFDGGWSLEVAVSTSDWYHSFEEDEDGSMLRTVSIDNGAALFMTKDLTEDDNETQAIIDSGPPYTLFVYSADSSQLKEVRRSHCGLETYAKITSTEERPSSQVVTSLTTRGHSRLPKQQFWVEGLDAKSAYTAILTRTGKSSLTKRQNEDSGSDGVQTFPETQFETATGDNCKVITDLEFCSDIEYSVPANEERFNTTTLAKKYDDYAKTMYGHFEKVLQQIPCEAPVTSKYSLARSCEDCKLTYKNWLCTVAMPRCEDFFSSKNTYALPRNLGQAFPNGTTLDEALVDSLKNEKGIAVMSSRNEWIDREIAPGPYKEVLPCDDVCYELVQSCPAKMGFSCPLPGADDRMFLKSYEQRGDDGEEGRCNALGSPIRNTGAVKAAASGLLFSAIVVLGAALL